MTSKEFVKLLRDCDMYPRSYSGRGMCGHQCVGVEVDVLGELLTLGVRMAVQAEAEGFGFHHIEESALGEAYHDTLGMGYIVYWPLMSWPKED